MSAVKVLCNTHTHTYFISCNTHTLLLNKHYITAHTHTRTQPKHIGNLRNWRAALRRLRCVLSTYYTYTHTLYTHRYRPIVSLVIYTQTHINNNILYDYTHTTSSAVFSVCCLPCPVLSSPSVCSPYLSPPLTLLLPSSGWYCSTNPRQPPSMMHQTPTATI
jgi:hypothetical protein